MVPLPQDRTTHSQDVLSCLAWLGTAERNITSTAYCDIEAKSCHVTLARHAASDKLSNTPELLESRSVNHTRDGNPGDGRAASQRPQNSPEAEPSVFQPSTPSLGSEDPLSSLSCAIDLESIAPAQAYALPCGHVFHTQCIETWLRESLECPTCRTNIHAYDSAWNDATDELVCWPPSRPRFTITNPDLSKPSTPASSQHGDSNSDPVSAPSSLRLLVFHVTFVTELVRLQEEAEQDAPREEGGMMMEHWAGFLQAQIAVHRAAMRRLCAEVMDSSQW
ncbi:hypothetical protein LTR53_016580 [Teratosphaeriaceae sp. CCFEE 6253]|nr:hypothetical protein LTR53_016580 [Teratosphaeriaceae sp. CCFEE 6253]